MPRGERPLDSGDSALLEFARELRRLRMAAGNPTYRELSARAHYSVAALSEAANGRKLPSLPVTLAYVAACDGSTEAWEQRWRKVSAEISAEPERGDNDDAPYVGLKAFQVGDAELFFGRDTLITELRARLRERRFLGVFGASGSGKSSVLRAGLVAQLIQGPVRAIVFTPGAHPIEECAIQLAALTGTSPAALRTELAADPRNLHVRIRQALSNQPDEVELVLVVDQFEELFTLCADRDEREWLVTALTTAALAKTSRTRVVLGVGADFYGHCGRFPRLVDALRDAQVLVGSMDETELRQAITGPAVRAGLRVETALVSRLIAATANQTGDLPLISHVLLETWRRRRGTALTLAGYEASGGIAHAVARTAEDIHASLDNAQQGIAKQIFLRLTAVVGGADDTKRRVSRHELDNADPNTGVVLEKLARARLITLDRDSVELAHEALIRHWPRLRDWLAADRDGLRIHRQLTDATAIWDSVHRDPGALYRGTRLAAAQEWAATRDSALTPREREFLATSLSAQAREQAASRRRGRRLRQLAALLTVLLVLSVVATGFAVRAQQTATHQRTAALAQKVLREATALRATNPALALQLTLAAYRLDPTQAARDGMREMFATPYATRLADHSGNVFGVAISHDGRVLATATLGQEPVRLRDISDPRRPRDLPGLPVTATAVAFSPNSPILAASTVDGGLRMWDLTDPQHPRQLADGPVQDRDNTIPRGVGTAIAFRPDGAVIATSDVDRIVRLWDIANPSGPLLLAILPGGPSVGRTPGFGASVAFSHDGRTLATTARDRTARLWDVTTPREPVPMGALTGHTESVLSVAFAPGADVVATTSQDRTARLWNVADPRNPALLAQLTGHSGNVTAAAFSPDGSTLATAGEDRTTRLWNVADPREPSEMTALSGHTNAVLAVAFSPDGRTLVTGSTDRTARLEDISQLVLANHSNSIFAIATSPRGLVATSSGDQTIRLWDFTEPRRPRQVGILRPEMEPASLSFSSNGRLLAAIAGQTVWLWDVHYANQSRGTAIRDAAGITGAELSPTGPILAVAGRFGMSTELLDVSDPHSLRTVGHIPAKFVAFRPNGQVLTTGQYGLQLWDITDTNNPRKASGAIVADTESAVFSPDGRLLAVAHNEDRTIRLWDLTVPPHPKELGRIPTDLAGLAVADFSPDGKKLVTDNADKFTRVWDISDPRHPVEDAMLRGGTAEVHAFRFISSGTIVTGDNDHVIRTWEIDIERLAGRVCELAHPRLTRAEWDQYFPGLDYQPPCP